MSAPPFRAAFRAFQTALALSVVLGLMGPAASIAAQPLRVDDTRDRIDSSIGNGVCRTGGGTCTLRAAIQEANALPGADTIDLPAGVYELQIPTVNDDLPGTGDHDITNSLTIVGAGAGATIIDGGFPLPGASPEVRGLDRLFEVHPTAGDVTISGVTLREGFSGESGGAVQNWSPGRLRFEQVHMLDNLAAKDGGGINNGDPNEYQWASGMQPPAVAIPSGRVELVGSTLSGNAAGGLGAAVNNVSTGTVSISAGSRVTDNPGLMVPDPQQIINPLDPDPVRFVPAEGVYAPNASAITNQGAINSVGTIRVADSTVSGNYAMQNGAGILNLGSGNLIVERSTITKNTTQADGGGIYSAGGAVTVNTTSFTDNLAHSDGGGFYSHGTLSAIGRRSRISIASSTFTRNEARAHAGAIYNDGDTDLIVTDVTVKDNHAWDAGGGLATFGRSSLALNASTLTDNSADGEGGGLFTATARPVSVKGSTVSQNSAGVPGLAGHDAGGGGVYTEGGPFDMSGSTIAGNTATAEGGGLAIDNLGDVTIADTLVRDNFTPMTGGGIENSGARVTFERMMVRNNRATGDGGGIHNSSSGEFTVLDSTIRENRALSGGGFTNASDSTLVVRRSLLYRNVAKRVPTIVDPEDGGLGGGFYNVSDGNGLMENTTVSSNTANVRGGGMFHDADAAFRIVNTTIWRNSAPFGGGISTVESDFVPSVPPQPNPLTLMNTIVGGSLQGGSCDAMLTSHGGNLDSGTGCAFQGQRDRGNSNAALDAIADNGGPTLTHAPRADSIAVDWGLTPCVEADQRGVERPQHLSCDSGAVEYDGPVNPPDVTPPDTEYLAGPVQDSLVTIAFQFTGSDDATPESELAYECRLVEHDLAEAPDVVAPWDPVPLELQFVSCMSGWQRPLVEEGLFTFEVRAIDRGGNVDPTPAIHTFGGDTTPPETLFAEKPPLVTNSRGATFTFTGVDNQTPPQFLEYECRLDSRDPELWLECLNPTILSNLTSGQHTMEVRASDGADNMDPTPARYTWTVGQPENCDQANVTLTAAADGWVDQVNPLENFLFHTNLTVRSDASGSPETGLIPANARALVRFGVPMDTDCRLESATLRLYGSSHTEGRTLHAVPLAGAWRESTVNWSNQPPIMGSPVAAESGEGYREWDVLSHVEAMTEAGQSHGWSIRDAAETDVDGGDQAFISREQPQDPPPVTLPQLVLRYEAAGTAPPVPPSIPPGTAPTTVHCGQTLTRSTLVGNDLTGCLGEGLVIGAPNIKLDLNGHTITSGALVEPGEEDGLLAGIRNSGYKNVVIANGTVRGFGYGVRLTAGTTFNVVEDLTLDASALTGLELNDADDGRNGNLIRRNTITSSGQDAVSLFNDTENNVVIGNTLDGNAGVAFHLVEARGNRIENNHVTGIPIDPLLDSDGGALLVGSSGNVLRGNTITDTGDAGVVIHQGSNGNRIEGNVLTRNGDAGVTIADSDRNQVIDNVAHRESDGGVVVSNGDDTVVRDNDVRFNPSGLEASGTDRLVVERNDASDSMQSGLQIGSGLGMRVVDNVASSTGGSGISLEGGAFDSAGLPVGGALISGNTTNENAESGISVAAGGHRIGDNDAHNNAAYGIRGEDDAVDLGGNRASGNGRPEQCIGVVCDTSMSVALSVPDTTAPVTRIDSHPPDPTTSTTARFTFSAEDAGTPETAMVYECRLNPGPDPLPEPEPEPDTEPPEPNAPPEPPDTNTPPDGEGWAECVSPLHLRELDEGRHHFQVRALDQADNRDRTPATQDWSIEPRPDGDTGPDELAPETRITEGPASPTISDVATFRFAGSDNSTPGFDLRYQCRLDAGAFEDCTAPKTYVDLSVGSHTVAVRAMDRTGNVDPTPALHTWVVEGPPPDTTPPETTIDSGPDPVTVRTDATFTLSTNDPNATFECSLDEAPWVECLSPLDYTGLNAQDHELRVRAVDQALNADPSPARYGWTIGPAPVATTVFCGQILTRSTRVLNDLANCQFNGLVIGADGITVDLDGHTIDGVGLAAGVRNDGYDSVTVRNGKFVQFDYGVALDPGTTRNIVEDLTLEATQVAGIALGQSTQADPAIPAQPVGSQSKVEDNTLRDNDVIASSAVGIWLSNGTKGTLVRGNSLAAASAEGIWLENSTANRVEHNDVAASSGDGIALQGSSANTIAENVLTGNDRGILVGVTDTGTVGLPSDSNRIERNTVEESGGIRVIQSSENELIENVVKRSTVSAITLESARDNVLRGNDVRSNHAGISLKGSSGNRIDGNDASESGSTGIVVANLSFNNVLLQNTSSGNDGDGIYVGDEAGAGSGTLIERNRTHSNKGYGIYVPKPSHTITANAANDNGSWGIWVAENSNGRVNVDGGGNRAIGNNGPLDPVTLKPQQCFVILCVGGTGQSSDVTAPDTSIVDGPPDPTTSDRATFRFSGSDDVSSVEFQCSIDASGFGPCTSPRTYEGLAPGSHTFAVRAVDGSGNVDLEPATRTWLIGERPVGQPPETTIDAGPDLTTVRTSAAFAFSADESGATFECALDAAAFAPCTSPATYTDLAVATHVLKVRATDRDGNVDQTPATFSWRITDPMVAAEVACGEFIVESTRVLNDLLDCSGHGLIVGAPGITIDLDGHVIDGVGVDAGIINHGHDSVTVTGGTLREFDYGVQLNPGTGHNVLSSLRLELNQEVGIALADADEGGNGTTVRGNELAGNRIGVGIFSGTRNALVGDNTFTANRADGVRIEHSRGNRVTGNTILGSAGFGVVMEGGGDNAIFDNVLETSGGAGIAVGTDLLPSNDNRVESNTIEDSNGAGIAVSDSARTTLLFNAIRGSNGPGAVLDLARDTVVRGNDLRSNATGITLSESSGNRIESNNASGTLGDGIALELASVANVVRQNTASGNSGEGIAVEDSAPSGQGNLLEGNTADSNGGDGIHVAGVGHTVTANTVRINGGWGIYAPVGAIDGGGNFAAGNVEPDQCLGVVCALGTVPGAPDTQILDKPSNPSNSRNGSFTYTGTDDTTPLAQLQFECRLDSASPADWVECEYPHVAANLSPGQHTLEIRALDSRLVADPTPASYTWTYSPLPSGRAPEVSIDVKPDAETWLMDVLFTFHADEPDVSFECRVDTNPYEPCGFEGESRGGFEWGLTEEEAGLHTFRVRATDFEGNVGQPATYDWRLFGVVTSFLSGPGFTPATEGLPATGGPVTTSDATIDFIANVADATYECSLDLEPFVPCTAPVTYTGLGIGSHELRVVATDLATGVESEEEAVYEWEVLESTDSAAPDTSIERAPATGSSSTIFEFVGIDDQTPEGLITFECRLDSTNELDWSSCLSPHNLLDFYTYQDPQMAPGEHTFEVRAIDAAEPLVPDPSNPNFDGNVDPTPATHTWVSVADTAPPGTGILSAPAGRTGELGATFEFFGNDDATPALRLAFECSLDDAAFAPCSTPYSLSLEAGVHTMRIRAVDLAGNADPTPAERTWTVVAPPVTTISSGPPSVSTTEAAVFEFGADQAGSTFECRVDGAEFAPCTSPYTTRISSSGGHRLDVRATNPEGIVEDPAAMYDWTAELGPDTVRPDTRITSGPQPSTANTVATFQFRGSDNRTFDAELTFECALDSTTSWSSCTSPEQFSDLVRGSHVLLVRSRDQAGNFDATPARHEWTVAPPPHATIVLGPESPSEDASVTFTFSSDVPGSTFECWLDGPKGPCTSPVTYHDVALGEHIFAVRATDPGGQTNPVWTEWDWVRADTTPPITTIHTGPGFATESTEAEFSFTANEPGVTFQCSLDGANFGSCSSPRRYPRLHPGPHRFAVQAIPPVQTDAFGQPIEPQYDPVPAVYEWTIVDNTPPDTSIEYGPRATTAGVNAIFGLGSDDPSASFECSLDGAPFVECDTPAEFADLTRTSHTLVVRAIDLAGNVDPTPATHDWTITEPPLNTPVGTNVTVELPMPDGPGTATVNFFEVTLAGGTVLDGLLSGAALPAGYSQAGSRFYELTTTAQFGEPATVCLAYDRASFPSSAVRLLEGDGSAWTDITLTNDPAAGRVCGEAEAFASFAVAAATSGATPLVSILSAPPNPSDSGTATFTFAADLDGAMMQCSIDGQPFTACTSPVTYTHLDTGGHDFQVQAMGPFGVSNPTLYEWEVALPPDATAPETSITKAPPARTGNYSVMFEFTGSDDQTAPLEMDFQCSVDGGLFEQCSAPYEVVVTTPGEHRFEVRAVDVTGNVDATPAGRSWTVIDVTPPDTTITLGPNSETGSTSATFEFTGVEPDGTAVNEFECSLDGADFAACSSPHAVHDLAPGSHVMQARAKDAAGMVDPTPDVHEWAITGPADTAAPETTIATAPPAVSGPDVRFGFLSNELTSGYECSLDAGAFAACQAVHELVGLAAGQHVLAVRAVDLALNTDPTPAEHRWTVLAAPETTIESRPPDPSQSVSATFTFSSEQAGVTFQCSVDGSEFAACTSPFTAGPLTNLETHDFDVRAVSRFTNIAGEPIVDETPATYMWTVSVPPDAAEFDTTLLSTPPAVAPGGPTALTTFTFQSDPLAYFQCSLDGAAFEQCTSPLEYEGLPDGEHTLRVRAVDLADNPDATPASYTWRIEAAPETTLDGASPTAQTDATTATFAFSSNRADATFECSLDRASFTECASGIAYADVPYGPHEFVVRAKGPFGTVDETPETHVWESGHLTAPDVQIASGPAASTLETTATFTFMSSDPDALFLCSLDGAPATFCSSPKEYTNVTPGQEHTLEVEATKRHLLVDGVPATYTWTVGDEAPPETTILSGPPAITPDGSPMVFEFAGSDNAPTSQLTFECSLDGAAFTACSSPYEVQGLAAAEHTLAVRAVDQAGNVDSTPATYEWRIAPLAETTIDSGPDSTTESRSATFTFSGNDADATFECSLDGAAFTACASPQAYTGLALGLHRLEVRSTNSWGLTDETPASQEWTIVDTTPPETAIDSGPDATTASRSAAFSFSASEPDATFECSLDAAPFAPCDSPREYAVAPGTHELLVQATDPAENTDPTPASWTWTVSDAPAPPTSAPAAPQPTTVTCGQVLTQSTLVQNDLTDCRGEGLVIGAANIVVDLGGHTIDGPDYLANPPATNETLPAGIRNSGFDNVRITNGTVQQFGDGVLLKPGSWFNAVDALSVTGNAIAGIHLSGADDSTIGGNTVAENTTGIQLADGAQANVAINNTLNANLSMAIHVLAASGNRIESNRVSGLLTSGLPGSDGGIRLDGATNNVLLSNAVVDTGDSGIVLVQGSHGNRIEGSTLTRTGDSGVHVQDSDRTQVIGNVASQMSDNGVGLSAANGSVIRGNDVRFNAGGIELENAGSDNRIEDNDASDSGGAGISIAGEGLNNVVEGNTASRNGAQGIFVDGSAPAGSGNLIRGNTTNANLGGGIRVAGSGHTITANTANDNASWGIFAADGNIDGGGNVARRNAEPGQCFNVLCNDPPTTTIVSGPDEATESTTASFTFSSDQAGATFECALDAGAYAPCDGQATFTDLALGEHDLLVRAVDSHGTPDPTPASYSWEIGEIPANVTIDSAPASTTERTSATFEFTADEPDATFECALDAGAWASCESPKGYSELPLGEHRFQVRARASADAIVDAPIETHTWTIGTPPACTAAPVTVGANADSWIDQGSPSANKGTDSVLKVMSKGPSNNLRALIRFANPALPPNCGVASATLRIYAASAVSSRSIEALRITGSWSEGGVTWSNQPPTDGPAAAVTSAVGYREWNVTSQLQAMYIAGANHGFLLRDLVENGGGAEQQYNSREKLDNPAQLVITLGTPDITDPNTTIDSGPNPVTTSRTAKLTFSSNEAGSTFECSLDKAAWAACASPKEYTGLELGAHNVRIRAKDPAGNVDATPARYDWTIEPDTTAPETTIGSAPAATSTSTSASFAFSSDEAGSTFECSLDGAAFASCTSPKAYSDLAAGGHAFRVRASDAAGNTDGSPATYSWTIEASSCTATTATASADRDSWVLQSSSSSNFGTDSVLKVDSKSGANARGLVRFALPAIPNGCQVTGVKLRLYASSYKSGRTLNALQVNGSWSEGGVTWANQPATTGTAASAPSRSSSGYMEWTVTSQVQSMYSGTNHGFLIRDATEGGGGNQQSLHSKEKAPDNPPQLVVTFG